MEPTFTSYSQYHSDVFIVLFHFLIEFLYYFGLFVIYDLETVLSSDTEAWEGDRQLSDSVSHATVLSLDSLF